MKTPKESSAPADLFAVAEAREAQMEQMRARIEAHIQICFDMDRIAHEDARGAVIDKRPLRAGQTQQNFARRVGAYTNLQHLVLECKNKNISPPNLRLAVKMLNSGDSPLPAVDKHR